MDEKALYYLVYMRLALLPFILLSILWNLIFCRICYAQEIGHIEWISCPSPDCPGIHDSDRIQFGKLTVPENYAHLENGRTLAISFAVIKARKQASKPDPVLVFAGGWGSPILQHIDYFSEYFLGEDRDIILYDYRGLGYSEPIICPDIGEIVYAQLVSAMTYQEFKSLQIQLFANCLDSLEYKNIDWNQYGTDQRSKDANLLLEQLAYPSYNLLGTSGGTRTIQSFIRNATVDIRSAIMDSSVPIGYPIIFDGIANYRTSLNRILRACVEDPRCNNAYPNLGPRFFAFLAELDKKPLNIKLRAGPKATLNRQEVNALVYNHLHDKNNFETLPFFLETLLKRKKFILRRMLNAHQIEGLIRESINGPGFLNYMNDYKVFQSAYKPSSPQDSLTYESLDSYFSYFPLDSLFEISDLEKVPIQTDVPTLFLVGMYDPTTPPKYTQFMEPNFSHSITLKFPKAGHGLFNDECAQESILRFIEHPDKRPVLPCLESYDNWEMYFFIRGKK